MNCIRSLRNHTIALLKFDLYSTPLLVPPLLLLRLRYRHWHVRPDPVLCSCKYGCNASCRSFLIVVFASLFFPIKMNGGAFAWSVILTTPLSLRMWLLSEVLHHVTYHGNRNWWYNRRYRYVVNCEQNPFTSPHFIIACVFCLCLNLKGVVVGLQPWSICWALRIA